MPYVAMACAVCLGIVFVISAFSKVRAKTAYTAFAESTAQLLPHRSLPVTPIATVVIAGEVAVPVLLPIVPRAGFTVAAALLSAFAVAITLALRRGVRSPCKCFGSGAKALGPAHAWRSAVLALLALIGAATAAATPLPELIGTLPPGGSAVACGIGTVAAILAITIDQVIDLFTPMAAQNAWDSRKGIADR